ncbi:MAG: hypothetical protein U0838_08435 [Chloroflexota bacterium]
MRNVPSTSSMPRSTSEPASAAGSGVRLARSECGDDVQDRRDRIGHAEARELPANRFEPGPHSVDEAAELRDQREREEHERSHHDHRPHAEGHGGGDAVREAALAEAERGGASVAASTSETITAVVDTGTANRIATMTTPIPTTASRRQPNAAERSSQAGTSGAAVMVAGWSS